MLHQKIRKILLFRLSMVIHFGLINLPSIFQPAMNCFLGPYLWQFCFFCFFSDILISNWSAHLVHLLVVFNLLEARLLVWGSFFFYIRSLGAYSIAMEKLCFLIEGFKISFDWGFRDIDIESYTILFSKASPSVRHPCK